MYVEQNIMQGEAVIQKAKLSPAGAIAKWILFLATGIGTIISGINVEQKNTVYDLYYYSRSSVKLNPAAVIFLVLFGIMCLSFLISAIASTIELTTNELGLTTKRLIGKVGTVAIKAMDAPLNKVQNISISFGVFGRLFGYGAIKIHTASGVFAFKSVVSPDVFKNIIMEQVDIYEKQETQKNAETIARAVMMGQTTAAQMGVAGVVSSGMMNGSAQNQSVTYCPRCNTANSSDTLFCKACGNKLR